MKLRGNQRTFFLGALSARRALSANVINSGEFSKLPNPSVAPRGFISEPHVLFSFPYALSIYSLFLLCILSFLPVVVCVVLHRCSLFFVLQPLSFQIWIFQFILCTFSGSFLFCMLSFLFRLLLVFFSSTFNEFLTVYLSCYLSK